MDDTRQIQRTLDLALRVGEMLLSNGAGAADVTATMSSIAHHLGLRQAQVDVTFTTLEISYQAAFDEPAFSLTRHVTHRETDFEDLTDVDQVVTDLLRDDIDLDEARTRVARIASTGHHTSRWAVTVSYALIGAGIALLIGGDWLVTLIAAAASGGIEILQRYLSRLRLPFFYAQVAGGLLATLMAVAASAIDLDVDPSLVITASIVMLLAGLGFIGAIQDALTGFYVTAVARILEVMMSTAGIIVGVSGGLTVGGLLGVDITLDPGVAGLSRLPLMVTGAAIAAGAFAYSAYAPRRSIVPIAAVGGVAAGIYLFLADHDVGRAWPAGLAAVFIGLVGFTVAGWCRVPPLVVVVAAIVPLLPGLSIYRGLSMLAADNYAGILAMITAAAIAISLAAGVILGEYVAQPVRREARRLEQRLAGPRLVGPLRARAKRR
ncbi:threonine/serine exporter family protein [Aeromicrobium sp. SMF47]|uniref:Threonine/serine exporter family protein n=1 Tax=Aeromicrobium yanjiei TaxID=2662028 RepID=A0A5Q2ME91_9ACTN|nr:threonine/serine exporter family protein [Aeromicrobium yanjiei]MRK02534.1 threonine/serine exporter family protein [Aeromicrobium sp. S22]QGG40143.1 threonine/serine exporter family protein [Aeromicrobium yanjiei]